MWLQNLVEALANPHRINRQGPVANVVHSQPSSPPAPKVFPKEWRTTSWGDKGKELQYMNEYHPGNDKVDHLRILLYGPVGAGKSSFINSVNSILQGRMTGEALVDSTSGASFTLKYKTHQIKNGRNFYPFIFNDIMGLEKETNKGARAEDIILAMKGRVQDGHKFNPVSPLSEDDPGYNRSPTLNDKVHCLVCVIPTDKVAVMSNEVVAKMREIRLAASDMGIPQLAILTRIDQACPVVQEDVRKVYLSKYIKIKMEEFSANLGIPMNCIFPVKNYHEEIDLNDEVDVLILRALRQMIDFGDDFIRKL